MTLDDRLAQNITIRGFESINGDGEYFGNLDDNSIEVIKQAILSDLLEIIEENCIYEGSLEIRYELLIAVKEYCK